MNKYALGIDLGCTGTKFGLVNNDGNVLRTSSIPTQQYPDIDEYCDALCAGLNRIVEEEGLTLVYIIYGVICLAAALFVWKLVPETKGKTLEQITTMWREKSKLYIVK